MPGSSTNPYSAGHRLSRLAKVLMWEASGISEVTFASPFPAELHFAMRLRTRSALATRSVAGPGCQRPRIRGGDRRLLQRSHWRRPPARRLHTLIAPRERPHPRAGRHRVTFRGTHGRLPGARPVLPRVVQNRVIFTARDYAPRELIEATNYLNTHYAGLAIDEV